MADNSIEVIKNYIQSNGGLQRPNRYKVQFLNLSQPIQALFNGGSVVEKAFFSNAVSFGGRATDVVYDALSGYGYGRMVPKSTRYIGGIVMTVPITGNQWVLRFINRWFDTLYGNSSTNAYQTNTFTVPYYDDIVRPCKMQVSLLDMNGEQVSGGNYVFSEVYPIEALPIELNEATIDKFLTAQVVFNFRNYIIE